MAATTTRGTTAGRTSAQASSGRKARKGRRQRKDQTVSDTVDLLIAAAEKREEEQRKAAPKTLAQRIAARSEDGGSASYRLRCQIRPWLIAAGLFAVVGLAQLLKLAGVPALSLTAGVAAAVWFTLGLTMLIARSKVAPQRRRWMATVGVVAATWTSIATYVGLTWETAAAGLVAFYACAARWWMWYRYGYPDGPPVDPGDDTGMQVPAVPTDVAGRWRAYVSPKGGYLPGAYLSGHTTDGDISESWTVTIPPDGGTTYGELLLKLEKLSLALGVPEDQLLIERHPSRQPGLYVLKVIRNSPVAAPVALDEPDAHHVGDDLWITPSTFVDGGRASIDLATTNSAWSLFCVGGVGSGKSSAMNVMLLNALASGCVTHWYIDGQWGASSPLLAKTADWAALTPDDAEQMLQGLESLATYRSWENKVRGVEGFTPSPERPLLLVQIDECHAVWDDKDKAERWANLLRIFRKIGVSVWAASQSGNLQSTFGGSKMLRSRLSDRTAIVLYSAEKSAKLTLDGLSEGIDPAAVPKGIPGRGFLVTPQRDTAGTSTGEVRVAQMRFDYMPAGAEDQEQLLELFAQHPSSPLDPVALKGIEVAVGDAYDRRHTIAAERREAELAAFAELMDDSDADLTNLLPDLPTSGGPAEAPADDTDGIGIGTITDPVPALSVADLIPAQRSTDPTTTGPAADADDRDDAGQDDDQLTDAQRAVLDALAAGDESPSQIVARTGWSDRHVRKNLAVLLQAGHITQAGFGRYQTTSHTSADIN